MEATCRCFDPSSYGKLLDFRAFELGPAYSEWSEGAVDIPLVFRQWAKLPQYILPDCCSDLSFNYNSYHPLIHLLLFGCWWTLSILIFVLYWRKRHCFPLTFRSPKTTTFLWMVLNLNFSLVLLISSAAYTTFCYFYLIAYQILVPLYLFYYTVKTMQLAFIYKWNWAKMSDKLKYSQVFHKFKWLLSDIPYFSGAAVIIMLGVAISTFQITSVSVFSPTLNAYNSFRGFWWRIPEEFQAPINDTQEALCSCWDLIEVIVGDTSAAALNTTYEDLQGACFESYVSDCYPNVECSSACPSTSFLDEELSSSCINWFADYYATGACGYPSLMPSIASFAVCFSSYHPTFYFYLALIFLLILVNFIFACSVLRMDDQLHMRTEVVLSFLATCPCALLIIIEYASPEVRFEYIRLFPEYPLDSAISLFISVYSLIVSVGYPTSVAYYHSWTRRKNRRMGHQEGQHVLDDTGTKPSHVGSFWNENDDIEEELRFAIENAAAGHLFMKFVWKEFSVENFKFLQAVMIMFENSRHIPLQETSVAARRIFHTYLEEHAPLQVNLPYSKRVGIALAVTGVPNPHEFKLGTLKPHGIRLLNFINQASTSNRTSSFEARHPDPDSVVPSPLHAGVQQDILGYAEQVRTQELLSESQLFQWYYPVVTEIKNLIVSDSWPRFRNSPLYVEFAQLKSSQQTFVDTVGAILPNTSLASHCDVVPTKFELDTSSAYSL